MRKRHVILSHTDRGWGEPKQTSELSLKPFMKGITPLPYGWQTGLTGFALVFNIDFDI